MSKSTLEKFWSTLSWFASFGAFTVGFGPCGAEWLLLGTMVEEGDRHVG